MPSIIYLINVDWFLISHFLHLVRRARAEGYHVVVATEVGEAGQRLREEGFDIVELPHSRSGLLPAGLSGAITEVAQLLRRRPTAIVHGFGNFGILVGSLAGLRAKHRRRLFTITGRGFIAAADGVKARGLTMLARNFCRRVADGPLTRWTAENHADVIAAGLGAVERSGRVALTHGAGVDLQRFSLSEMPSRPPLRAAVVARMIWSKGIDTAVEGVLLARRRGIDVELTLAGSLDPANPRPLSEPDMRRLVSHEGIRWLGKIDDVPAFWRRQHLAMLASRGGEGVPKSLIEAASCGRPMVTTSVPGCLELARATRGWVVPPDDAEAFAEAIAFAANHPDLAQRGRAAREAVSADYSEAAVWDTVENFYRELSTLSDR